MRDDVRSSAIVAATRVVRTSFESRGDLASFTFIFSSWSFIRFKNPSLVSFGFGDALAGGGGTILWWVVAEKAAIGETPSRLVADDRLCGISKIDHPCTQSAAKGKTMSSPFMVEAVVLLSMMGGF